MLRVRICAGGVRQRTSLPRFSYFNNLCGLAGHDNNRSCREGLDWMLSPLYSMSWSERSGGGDFLKMTEVEMTSWTDLGRWLMVKEREMRVTGRQISEVLQGGPGSSILVRRMGRGS